MAASPRSAEEATVAAEREPDGPGGISSRLVGLLAVACGLSAANLYYAQPLLHTIARALHTGSTTAGLIVTASQVGYATGLALLVPVGDVVARRRLVPSVLVLTAAALAASAAAPDVAVLIGLALLVGVGSVAAQMLVPFAASLAGEARRGRVVGTVMSGLLLGILLARTLSGLVAGAGGWRVVYAVAAGLVLVLAAVLARALPAESARPHLPYGRLLVSTVRVFADDPVLRRRSLLGALAFAQFSVFWTTAAFLLSGAPFHYGDTVVGLFGLVGAAGALCASAAGRIADRHGPGRGTIGASGLAVVSWLVLFGARDGLVPLIVGIVILDVAVQGVHVTNQSVVFRRSGAAGSRANASYMVCYFVGGAIGSASAAALYASGGWIAVCVLGLVVAGLGIVGAVADRRWPAG